MIHGKSLHSHYLAQLQRAFCIPSRCIRSTQHSWAMLALARSLAANLLLCQDRPTANQTEPKRSTALQTVSNMLWHGLQIPLLHTVRQRSLICIGIGLHWLVAGNPGSKIHFEWLTAVNHCCAADLATVMAQLPGKFASFHCTCCRATTMLIKKTFFKNKEKGHGRRCLCSHS